MNDRNGHRREQENRRVTEAVTLVGQNERERTKFEHCQVEADETVIRKERIH